MLTFIRQCWHKLTTNKNKPLTKIILIIIIMVDIFILVNLFEITEKIGKWYLRPNLVYPCNAQWGTYQRDTSTNKDIKIIYQAIDSSNQQQNLEQIFRDQENGRIGSVSQDCLTYAQYYDKVGTLDNRKIIININQAAIKIKNLENKNNTIRSNNNSTNLKNVEQSKQELSQNTAQIVALNREIKHLEQELLIKPESANFIDFITQKNIWEALSQSYKNAVSWYPVIQFFLQALFLIFLISIAFGVRSFAVKANYGLLALVSWHLLVIFTALLGIKFFTLIISTKVIL